MQPFFEDGYQKVNRDGDPYLSPHGIKAGSVESFDAQVLFDPFEKQLDLPTTAIELSDNQSRFGKVVGQKHQFLAGHGIAEAYTTQWSRIITTGVKVGQEDGLIKEQATGFIDRTRIAS